MKITAMVATDTRNGEVPKLAENLARHLVGKDSVAKVYLILPSNARSRIPNHSRVVQLYYPADAEPVEKTTAVAMNGLVNGCKILMFSFLDVEHTASIQRKLALFAAYCTFYTITSNSDACEQIPFGTVYLPRWTVPGVKVRNLLLRIKGIRCPKVRRLPHHVSLEGGIGARHFLHP